MFDKVKNLFKSKPPVQETPAVKTRKRTAKEIATEKGEPYVAILSVDVKPEDINQGAFELDWNDKFVADLVRSGYQGKTDADIVDQWFQNVCRNVALETWENEQAMNTQEPQNKKPLYK